MKYGFFFFCFILPMKSGQGHNIHFLFYRFEATTLTFPGYLLSKVDEDKFDEHKLHSATLINLNNLVLHRC